VEPLHFEQLYREHHDRVWRTLLYLGVPSHCLDDVLQEVFVLVHRKLSDPLEFRTVTGWIYAVTRRLAFNHRRKAARYTRRLAIAASEPQPVNATGPDQIFERNEAAARVHHFAETLHEPLKTAFVLCEIEGLSVAEVAEIAGAKVSTMHSRLRLARGRFREFLEQSERQPLTRSPCNGYS